MHSYLQSAAASSLSVAMPTEADVLAGQFLRRRRKEKGLTQEQVSDKINLNHPNYLGMLEKGNISLARSKYLQPLAQLLGFTADEVRQINPDAIVELTVAQEPPQLRTKEAHRVAVRGLAAAGRGTYTEIPIIGFEYVINDLYRPGMEIVQVEGDSMAPGIQPDDYAYIDPGLTDPEDGKIFLVLIEGNGYVLKRTRRIGGQFMLMSDNPAHEPILPSQARVIGRMFYHQPRGRHV